MKPPYPLDGRPPPSPLPGASRIPALRRVRSELANIDNAEYVGAVAGHEQLRSVLANETNPSPRIHHTRTKAAGQQVTTATGATDA